MGGNIHQAGWFVTTKTGEDGKDADSALASWRRAWRWVLPRARSWS
jgi:hypothetical protein